MSSVYEELADYVVATLTGSHTGVSRDEFVAMFKTKFPIEADFREFVAGLKSQASQINAIRFPAGAGEVLVQAPAKAEGSWLH